MVWVALDCLHGDSFPRFLEVGRPTRNVASTILGAESEMRTHIHLLASDHGCDVTSSFKLLSPFLL